jgi:3-deoxy-manno-octulosonate cytidylyltransferase (CMP-KDO synthetase)
MKIVALIPARMGSSRFPGKPLADLLGKPMIGHVYERVARNPQLSLTAVATCDREIFDYVSGIGGRAVMTGSHHERASDRCAEALEILERADGVRYDIVVMVQGDEPMIDGEMISEALGPLLTDSSVQVVNLLGTIESEAEFQDRNCIKAVCDLEGNALYMSREAIPTRAKQPVVPMGKQVCVIPFRRDFLLQYTRLQPTPLELAESIDMLRVLEHGYRVRMVPTRHQSHSVDTPDDLRLVARLMREQPPGR